MLEVLKKLRPFHDGELDKVIVAELIKKLEKALWFCASFLLTCQS